MHHRYHRQDPGFTACSVQMGPHMKSTKTLPSHSPKSDEGKNNSRSGSDEGEEQSGPSSGEVEDTADSQSKKGSETPYNSVDSKSTSILVSPYFDEGDNVVQVPQEISLSSQGTQATTVSALANQESDSTPVFGIPLTQDNLRQCVEGMKHFYHRYRNINDQGRPWCDIMEELDFSQPIQEELQTCRLHLRDID